MGERESSLEGRVSALEDRSSALESENRRLKRRIGVLENGGSTSENPAEGRFDARDGSVLDALSGREGDEFHVRALMKYYRADTDIRRRDTLKRRVKDLIKSDLFESVGDGRHRFLGGDEHE